MIIDKKGRLFGKISLIDILSLAGLVLLTYFFFRQLGVIGSRASAPSLDTIELVFYQEEVNDFTAQNVKIGDPTSETLKNVSFGEVTAIDIDESISWHKDPDGLQVASSRDGYKSIRITSRVKGNLTDNGLVIEGARYFVGQTIVFKAGSSMFYGDIAGVRKI